MTFIFKVSISKHTALQNASPCVYSDRMTENMTTIPFRSSCPVACLLDIIGDKWTLLIIRDLFLNKHRFGEFSDSPERIPTNLLAERLKRLEAAGLICKELYQLKPPRAEYFLTRKGADLGQVLAAMRNWSQQHIEGVQVPEITCPPEIRD